MAAVPQNPNYIGNEISTALASGITNSATTITVVDGAGMSASGGYIIIDEGNSKEEVVYI